MTDEKKALKVIFAPGCFDSFEGTQEELDSLVNEINQLFESGEFEAKSIPVHDILDDMSDEEWDELFKDFSNESDTPKKLH